MCPLQPLYYLYMYIHLTDLSPGGTPVALFLPLFPIVPVSTAHLILALLVL